MALLVLGLALPPVSAKEVALRIKTPMAPPNWALLERALLRANTAACKEFFRHYFDERGYLLCVERWGGDDGADDAIENCLHWPLLHALGAPEVVRGMYRKAWEGHLRQYTRARTVKVPFAREGMYYKEFPVMFDWLHNSEGLTVFSLQGLSDPHDRKYRQRVRRYAGFYLNEDEGAPNFDPRHKIIRSLFNGSRGPLLRKATALDWAGDPLKDANRFHLLHGERNYEEMLAHFKDYTDIVGDHPLNLLATALALDAYMLKHEPRYKKWLLEYVDAWRERMLQNRGIIPTNIGLDGKIGTAAGGKWYGGVYGWGFTVVVPQTGQLAHRNSHGLGFQGFMNAYLLTGDDRYLDAWRKQIDLVNSHKKVVNGKVLYPHMYGDKGWYHYTPEKYLLNARELYYLSMKQQDLQRLPLTGWFAYLEGKNPAYPEEALRAEFTRIRQRALAMRKDPTTPATRLSDDPLAFNPASVGTLMELMLGGLLPGKNGLILHCRLRYFDPVARRAGVPPDVAALVEKLTPESVTVTLVNTNQLKERTVTVQAGGYAEHQFLQAAVGGRTIPIDAPHFTVRLAPGTGSRIVLKMKRYVNQPDLNFPWDREGK
jgi:hypothetical protein